LTSVKCEEKLGNKLDGKEFHKFLIRPAGSILLHQMDINSSRKKKDISTKMYAGKNTQSQARNI
jgi:hypothetical protein